VIYFVCRAYYVNLNAEYKAGAGGLVAFRWVCFAERAETPTFESGERRVRAGRNKYTAVRYSIRPWGVAFNEAISKIQHTSSGLKTIDDRTQNRTERDNIIRRPAKDLFSGEIFKEEKIKFPFNFFFPLVLEGPCSYRDDTMVPVCCLINSPARCVHQLVGWLVGLSS
jgi:hypothetical protein